MMRNLIAVLLGKFLCNEATLGESPNVYLGFDRNDYPGDSSLPALHKTFLYTSYWLNNPPGEKQNSWTGKRSLLKQQGFGFLVLLNGRLDAELKRKDAVALGAMDGKSAVTEAAKEGFRSNIVIFLDQEEGGRFLPEQLAYILAWVDAIPAGGDRAGIYCSGIKVPDGSSTISTAEDVVAQEKARARITGYAAGTGAPLSKLYLWVADDQCHPSPECTETDRSPSDGFSAFGADQAIVWQLHAQSPRREQFSASCPKNNDSDGNCYAPGLLHSASTTFLDLNVANSPDPSEAP
jgi:Domain of unknown function (DUF1906)